MTDRIQLLPWSIRDEAPGWADDFAESVFFSGNGRMGARGYLPFEGQGRGVKRGLFVAGIYGEIKAGITDFVNLPTPIWEQVCIDGTPATLCSDICRELNLESGEFRATFQLSNGRKQLSIDYSRLFSLDNTGLLLQRTRYTPHQAMELSVVSGLFCDSVNCPVPDDQTKDNPDAVSLVRPFATVELPTGFRKGFQVVGTGLTVEMSLTFQTYGWEAGALLSNSGGIGIPFTRHLCPGEPGVLEKQAFITTSRDEDPRIQTSEPSSYDTFKERSDDRWQVLWVQCRLNPSIWSQEELTALRYNAFQLLTSCSSRDSTVSIGARGLTHTRYKGCYFWDTDMFMLPFFLAADPEAARNLCLYRYRNLPQAKALSAKLNTKGARYPWMCSLDGTEQCETWDIGLSEVHITADVAYALARYCEHTGDVAFRLDYANEVWIETARFWRSRYTWNTAKKQFDLLFCKGPDEYCGIANNNLYTNVMVRYNVELALQAAKELQQLRPEVYKRLRFTGEEGRELSFFHDNIPLARDPYTGRLTSDDSFHLLEPVDIGSIKAGDGASYHSISYDRLQRYKVVKQADVLLLMTRLPERFTAEEKLQAWKDFEPICLHDSTLSFASHALFATMNGLDKAGFYLEKALYLDLKDVMGNTGKEGLHLACMGETWSAAQAFEKTSRG